MYRADFLLAVRRACIARLGDDKGLALFSELCQLLEWNAEQPDGRGRQDYLEEHGQRRLVAPEVAPGEHDGVSGPGPDRDELEEVFPAAASAKDAREVREDRGLALTMKALHQGSREARRRPRLNRGRR